ncbi:MAG: ArnT family glycosyltransferase [Steroidobacterales bacterium]
MTRPTPDRPVLWLISILLLASWCAGMFGRGYWTPDEPREADISWRMSWQADPAVPLLAGEAFCEKPPLTYWLAGASMRLFGTASWAARVPNLFYAIVTTLSVAWLARRLAGSLAAAAAAAASATFLLSYQVAIWLASDAPLLATVALALAGAFAGFYAAGRRERLVGYLVMHAALAAGFLAKSAAAWLVPALAIATLIVWEKRWREALRWELWIGLPLQALIIGAWVWSVYQGPQGADHLRVFFWNNLVGRFTHVDAPADLQYATGHRNSPGKYLLEMPIYLFPWTLLVIAAATRAWRRRADLRPRLRVVRCALAASLPALLVLSVAATARNIYVAPLLPAVALLLGWWASEADSDPRREDMIALRATAGLLLLATLVAVAAIALAWLDAGTVNGAAAAIATIGALGAAAGIALSLLAWRAAGHRQIRRSLLALLLAYCSLLVGPAASVYRFADRWQDLAALGAELKTDLAAAPLVLIAPDETTRAWVDMYVSTKVERIGAPVDERTLRQLSALMTGRPRRTLALVQLDGRALTPQVQDLARELGLHRLQGTAPEAPAWLATAQLRIARLYALPNGRRYALLSGAP